MSVTVLGIVLAALCIYYAGSATRLVQLVFIAGVFEAAAALIIGGSGLQPGLVPGITLIGLVTSQYMAGRRSIAEPIALRLLAPLFVLFAYAAVTAVLLPEVFAGRIIVWPQRLDGIAPQPVPLAPGQGNMNQVFYLAVNVALALSVTLALGRAGTRWRSLVTAYLLGGYFVIGLMVWEFAYRTMGVPYPTSVLRSNPGWSIVEQSLGYLPRLQGPFSEPSALGFYMSGLCLACTGLCLRGQRILRADVLLVLGCAATFLSTSATGIASLAVGLPAMVAANALAGRGQSLRRLWKVLAMPLVGSVLLIVVAVLLHPPLADALAGILESFLNKTDTDSFSERGGMNIVAWEAFLSSGGLGIGWGSTRSSSVLPGLLAGAGVVGAVTVVWFTGRLVSLVRQARRRAASDHPALPAIAAFGSALTGQLIAAIFAAPVITTPIFYVQIGILAAAAIRIRTDSRVPAMASAPRPARAMPAAESPRLARPMPAGRAR